MCAASLVRDYRARARANGITLSAENYQQVLDESEWASYEMAVDILRTNTVMKGMRQKTR